MSILEQVASTGVTFGEQYIETRLASWSNEYDSGNQFAHQIIVVQQIERRSKENKAHYISVSQNECPYDNMFWNISSVSPIRRKLFLIVAMKFPMSYYQSLWSIFL